MSSEPDWLARVVAITGLVVAAVSLAWQWYAWRRNGPYLRLKPEQDLRGPLRIKVTNSGRADVEVGRIELRWKGEEFRPFGPFIYRPKSRTNLDIPSLPITVKANHSAQLDVDNALVPEAFQRAVLRLTYSCLVVHTPAGRFKAKAGIGTAVYQDRFGQVLEQALEVAKERRRRDASRMSSDEPTGTEPSAAPGQAGT
ncbi:hypothetical protein [Micromonospora deserti]|uniref:hypothetical protein n=1 Tax=Micromonospora deserti TaxID=2070366 RepID=UPI0011B62CBC|nr:hypothetical protein [Micromonospora deserti]